MTKGWIKWTHWLSGGGSEYGEMPRSDMQKQLQIFEQEAKETLEKTKADHVLYAIKYLDDDGIPEKIHFYMLPMTEREFTEKVSNMRKVQVYALHAMK